MHGSPTDGPDDAATLRQKLDTCTQALARLQALHTRMIEALPGGVVEVAPDGAVMVANREAQAILGLKLDELTGRFITDFAGKTFLDNGEPCPVEAYPVAACLMTGQPQPPMVIGVQQPSGEVRWAVFTAFPIDPDPSWGKSAGHGALVTFTDISSRKREEEERRRLQEELYRSERLASVGTLAAGVAHEVNNPLTYVVANLALAQELLGELGPRAVDEPFRSLRDLLTRAGEGADRVRRIVGDLKTFARAPAGTAAPVAVQAALESSINMAMTEIRHRARLVREFDRPFVVHVDDARLCQVFLNLLINAAQAIPAGNPKDHRITVRVKAHGQDQVAIEVEDTGCGIPREMQDRIFEPFFTTKAGAEKGMGLGLAICRTIVSGMGGQISVESTPGQGATFRIILPAHEATAPPPARAFPQRVASRTRGRILVVDDEPEVVRTLALVLRDHDVTAVSSGRAAVELCHARAFDVILCDVIMPDGDGLYVHDELKKLPGSLADRIVFLSGGTLSVGMRDRIDRTSNVRLEKPFDLHALRAVVDGLLEEG